MPSIQYSAAAYIFQCVTAPGGQRASHPATATNAAAAGASAAPAAPALPRLGVARFFFRAFPLSALPAQAATDFFLIFVCFR